MLQFWPTPTLEHDVYGKNPTKHLLLDIVSSSLVLCVPWCVGTTSLLVQLLSV